MFSLEILLFAAVVALLLGLPVFSSEDRGEISGLPVPMLRVIGEAEIGIEPDIVTFGVGASVRDPSAAKAMADVSKITERLTAALRSADIPRENIQTTQISLNETEVLVGSGREGGNPRRVYEAPHALRVAVDKEEFAHLGDILDAAVRVGANFVEGIAFGIREENALRREGLMEAVRDARAKAEVMAAAANVPLQGILTLTEGGVPDRFEDLLAERMDLSLASVPPPVAPSAIRRTYTVVVEYAIGT